MMRAFAIAWACLGAALPAWGAAVPGSAPVPCPLVVDGGIERGELPHLLGALARGGSLNVLVVGPAASPGPNAGPGHAAAPGHAAPGATPNTGFPAQMAQELQAAVPGLHVSLLVVGGHGQPASAMLAPMRSELDRRHYQLVLWQTGTVDAVSMAAPEDFYQALADGAGIVSALGADLILVGPQYSRFLEANANMAPYLAALQEAAALPGVALFDRFGIMHNWVEADALDLERTTTVDRPAVAARLQRCLGHYLARALLRAE